MAMRRDVGSDDGPDLHYLPISNAHIAVTIKKGIKGQMPTFAKKYLTIARLRVIVSYLRVNFAVSRHLAKGEAGASSLNRVNC